MFESVLALTGALGIEAVGSGAGSAVSYASTQRLSCSLARAALPPVLASYGFDGIGDLDKKLKSQQGSLDVSMTVSIPGSLSDRWLEAPGERETRFFPVYARVSRAVQRAARTWLPYLYFSSSERYGDLPVAAPLVVYQASRPYAGQPKYDFSYDVLRDSSMASFYRGASGRLSKELARIEGMLQEEVRSDTAEAYRPKHARDLMGRVRRHPARVRSLLVADTCLVDAFVNLGCQAGQLRRQKAEDPRVAQRQLTRLANQLAKSVRSALRRLPGGQGFLALGPLLFVEATNALSGMTPSAIRVTLEIAANGNGETQTLVHAAWSAAAG